MSKFCRKRYSGMELVCIASLKELQDDNKYIKDEIVYAYIKILERFCIKFGSGKLKRVIYAESTFLSNLRLSKGKRKEKVLLKMEKHRKIWENEILLIPVLENCHWWLIYVDMKSHQLHSVDSLNKCRKKELQLVCNFLKEGWKEELLECGMLESSNQVDGVSCGAYIVYSMTLISFGKYTTMWKTLTPNMIAPLRCYVFYCIIQNEFHVLAHVCPICKHWYNCKNCGVISVMFGHTLSVQACI
jgi:Ulp1 family protease